VLEALADVAGTRPKMARAPRAWIRTSDQSINSRIKPNSKSAGRPQFLVLAQESPNFQYVSRNPLTFEGTTGGKLYPTEATHNAPHGECDAESAEQNRQALPLPGDRQKGPLVQRRRNCQGKEAPGDFWRSAGNAGGSKSRLVFTRVDGYEASRNDGQ